MTAAVPQPSSGSKTVTITKEPPIRSPTLVLRPSAVQTSAQIAEAPGDSNKIAEVAKPALPITQSAVQSDAAKSDAAKPLRAGLVKVEEKLPFAQRLAQLLAKMQGSQALPPEQRTAIGEWLTEFSIGFPHYNKGRNEGVSLALCYLLCRIIYPAMDAIAKDSPEAKTLMLFEFGLRKLLTITIPEGETVEGFIAVYQEFIHQKDMMDAKLDIILRTFQELMNQLYATAERENNNLVGRVQRLEERLAQANRDQQEGIGQVHASLEGVANRTRALFDEYADLLNALQIQENRMQQLSATFMTILEDCKRALQRLRR